MMDLDRIIDQLHIYEKKVLKAFEGSDKPLKPEEIAESQKIDIKSVMSASGALESRGFVRVMKDADEVVSLTEDGESCAREGLPERRLIEALKGEEELEMSELSRRAGLDKKEAGIGIGWLMRKGWGRISQGMVSAVSDEAPERGADERLLELLLERGSVRIRELPDELRGALKDLKGRKGIVDIRKIKRHTIELTTEGRKLLERGIEIVEEATQVTHEHLKSGAWRKLHYRGYNIDAEYPLVYPGKMHPLRRIIDEIRSIFLKLGFTESRGPIVESAFWNFDCLFQPQDHAAREMQDTFYVKNPAVTDLPCEDLVRAVQDAHETGGSTGSEGWQYEWDRDVARQSVLRTHTTCVSARFLSENKPPLKMFSVGRVFRRETITYKHLPEFHQVEGIVAGDEVNFRNLLGILREFYRKLGFEVRFRPAYFPYTYLSTECEIYLPEKKSWIELGGAGMFRPEVLEPLGVETPVAAFGLGIERLAMIRFDIKDIRMLYQSDLGWLRGLPVTGDLEL
ncbi:MULTISPECIES: phenylalanine--tRNA ligase subunit alpha [Methanothermobacter]|uniref:Phenylalanine--tRNA ligase alpha subunit n=1 Tax=Methanothermobacter defluvii TaxID=49339 RepID=A0A371NDN1_9EURY|nr:MULTISPECIES: phenylalanine--tRNA ligase subunit alpha [Methanothermobacter]REE28619.1 phenylalanyl-tRNA synthetase alpha subunit [Methanothermobacter defluvii]